MDARSSSERLRSLDILRGFDMFWITGGSGLVAALATATGWRWMGALEQQMHHVEWQGFRFYDLIFPLFIFIMGVAIPYAFLPRLESGVPLGKIYVKILRRFAILVIFGIFYNQTWLPDWSDPRIVSVLGQIGFAYLFGAIIFIHTRKLLPVVLWMAGILIVYGVLQNFIPVPGYGAGVLTEEGSMNAFLDQRITPGRLLEVVYDPLGIFNCISAITLSLMGIMAGLILRGSSPGRYGKVLILVLIGAGFIGAGLLLEGGYPVIKKAWTTTYNLVAGGISLVLMALFYLIVDVWQYRKWGFYFKVIGLNSITVYMAVAFISFRGISVNLFEGIAMHLGEWGGVLVSLGELAIIWTCLYLLYRNRIFLRI